MPGQGWPLPPRLPREHGAWALLTLPLVVGLAAAGAADAAPWLVACAFVLAFLARDPLVAWLARRRGGRAAAAEWWRRRSVWGALYLTGAAASFGTALALTAVDSRTDLAAVAAVAAGAALLQAVAEIVGAGRRAAVELVAMAGAVLAIPAMVAASGRPVDVGVLGLAVVPFAYFASSLAWVRAWRDLGARPRRARVVCVTFHAVLIVALLAAHAAGLVTRPSLAGFVPAIVRTVAGLAVPPGDLRAVGLREVWVAIATAVLAALAAA